MVVVVDEQRPNVGTAQATTEVIGMPSAIAFHHREEFGGACVGHPKVAFAVEVEAADVDEVGVIHPSF